MMDRFWGIMVIMVWMFVVGFLVVFCIFGNINIGVVGIF